MNVFEDYYIKQAGNGLHGFSGVRYQKGYGFFGRLLSNAVIPFLKFFGKNALKAGANVASDLVDGDDFSLKAIKESGKNRIKEQSLKMFDNVKNKVLKGSGAKKYKRRRRVKKIKAKKTFAKKLINKNCFKRKRKLKKNKRAKKKVKINDFLA
ncbi:MAG: hypothetical protein QM535_22420 [Limnohabitans sp.]|nr:hypothetical protein [Limnohabitans sp.]